MNITIARIKYALDNNYIPVVDMQNCKNPYLKKKILRKRMHGNFVLNNHVDIH